MQRAIAITLTIMVTAAFVAMVQVGNAEAARITEPQFSNVDIAILIGACLFPIMWIGVLIQRRYWYRG